MSHLQRRQEERIADKALRQELAQRLGSVDLAAKVTELAMTEVGGIHKYAVKQVTNTLSTTDALERSASYAGRMTPAKKAEIAQLTQGYLSDMLGITDEAAGGLVDDLLRP